MRTKLSMATALAGTLLATCLVSGSAQATPLPVLKGDATPGIVTLVGRGGGGHGGLVVAAAVVASWWWRRGGGHYVVAAAVADRHLSGRRWRHHAVAVATVAGILRWGGGRRHYGGGRWRALRPLRSSQSLRPLWLVWPAIRLLRLWWRLRTAISQRYSHWQFLLVEPLLRVRWLLLSLNACLLRGLLLSRSGDAWAAVSEMMRRPTSVIGGKADMARTCQYVR